MAAARSSKGQWRSFLIDLVRRSNPGIDCQLTPRQAFAALSKKFGVDVSNDDRLWVKETLYEVLQIEAEKAAAQKKQTRRQTHRTNPTLSSSDSDDDVPLDPVEAKKWLERAKAEQAKLKAAAEEKAMAEA